METMRQVHTRQKVQRESAWLVALTDELLAGGVVVKSLGENKFLIYIFGETAPKSTDYDRLTDTLMNAEVRVKSGWFGGEPIFGEITYYYHPNSGTAEAYYFHKTLLNGAITRI